MRNFERYIPTRFVFGKGAEESVGLEVKKLGAKKVLIHYGGGSAVRSGLIGRVESALNAEQIETVTLGGALPNPRDTKVYEGIECIRKNGVDFILAVGGGSAIDSAKAMAHGAAYDGDFWDFFSGKATPKASLPIGVVLTMAAAGSESSNSCVIMQEKTLIKRGLSTEFNRPKLAIMNPELTMTLPVYQIACGVTDILAHVMERYFTNEPDCDLTDRLCEATMQAVIRASRVAVKNPHDYDATAQIMWASTIAHNDTVGVGRQSDFASHQIEHELSGLYDVAHGAGLAVVFPAWMRYLYEKKPMRFAQFAVRVWGCEMDFEHPEKTALLGIEAHEQFLRDIGMPVTMRELGAKTEDIPYLAEHVKRMHPDGTTGHFYRLNTQDIEAILHIADR